MLVGNQDLEQQLLEPLANSSKNSKPAAFAISLLIGWVFWGVVIAGQLFCEVVAALREYKTSIKFKFPESQRVGHKKFQTANIPAAIDTNYR